MLGRSALPCGAQTLAATLLAALAADPARGAPPADPAAVARAVGQPAALPAQPEAAPRAGPGARQQVVVTGRYADGSVRDLTPFCEMAVEPADVAAAEAGGYLAARKSGTAALVVKAGGRAARVPLVV